MTCQYLLSIAFLVVILGATVILGKSAPPDDPVLDLTSLSDADLKTVTIHMERMGCYGSCPAYAVTIQSDGQVEYSGKNHVKEQSAQKGHVEIAAIKSLLSEFVRAKYLTLPEEQDGREKCHKYCTDMPTVITELTVKGKNHRVKHYYGCAAWPRELFDLESAIDKAVNSEQWTGDVSKAGPYGTTCWGG